MEISRHTPGSFCWADLGTTDQQGAKKFYSNLFGWSTDDMPIGPDSFYTMCQMNGKDVVALYQLDKDMLSQGIPPHWLPYISVESVDEAAKAVSAAGGKVMMEPFEVFDSGRMTVAQDPTGATFGMWQPRKHIGARIINENNAMCWHELSTRDTALAKSFYTKVFGWNGVTKEFDAMPYTEFYIGDPAEGKAAGGMMQMPDEWGEVPSHWMVYFAVDNCEGAVEKAKAVGAKITVPPTDVPNVGRFAMLEDPQGAHFAIIKLL
jgi:uncharacterized protein